MVKRRDKKPPKPIDIDAEWTEQVREKLARSIVQWLKASLNVERPIRSFSFDELKRLGEHVAMTWLVLQSERLAAPVVPADEREWLSGVLL